MRRSLVNVHFCSRFFKSCFFFKSADQTKNTYLNFSQFLNATDLDETDF